MNLDAIKRKISKELSTPSESVGLPKSKRASLLTAETGRLTTENTQAAAAKMRPVLCLREYPRFLWLLQLFNLFSCYVRVVQMQKLENDDVLIQVAGQKQIQVLQEVLNDVQIGNYRFSFEITQKELMISPEALKGEPALENGNLTIGKTYLTVSDVELEFQDRAFIAYSPTCRLSFNKAVTDPETL